MRRFFAGRSGRSLGFQVVTESGSGMRLSRLSFGGRAGDQHSILQSQQAENGQGCTFRYLAQHPSHVAELAPEDRCTSEYPHVDIMVY